MKRIKKKSTDRGLTPVYFNSTTKTVIDPKYSLEKSFQEVFNSIDNWISKGSSWIIESIDVEYVNISSYSPLPGRSYIELLDKLRNSKKVWLILKTMTKNVFFGVILSI